MYVLVNNLFLKLLINFKAGINSGYVMKPCLDPFDPECPKTAPNYKTKKVIIPVLFKEPVIRVLEGYGNLGCQQNGCRETLHLCKLCRRGEEFYRI